MSIRRKFFRASLFASVPASLTAECAIALPVFLVCMLGVIHLGTVCGTAVRLSDALAQTAEEMAVGAYAMADGEGDDLLGVVLSAAWASARTRARAGDTGAVKNMNFLLSSFRERDELIDLVLTYQIRLPVGMLRTPGSFWVQRAAARAWVGRAGSGAPSEEEGEDEESPTVYVAENGQVYHTDPECTHIHLSVMRTSLASLSWQRNTYGGKYHACELCGKDAGEEVYITLDGNRYHSSLHCSGLKRTIHETHLSEVGDLRPCSRCAK